MNGVSPGALTAEVALDSDRRDRYFETIDRETRRLERIVKDLLDLARYEHGGVVLQRRLFDIERRLENVAGRHEQEAHVKGATIHIHVDPLADPVVADPDRIEQAIENLVANSRRHTPSGGTITLSLHDRAAVVGCLRRAPFATGTPDAVPRDFARH